MTYSAKVVAASIQSSTTINNYLLQYFKSTNISYKSSSLPVPLYFSPSIYIRISTWLFQSSPSLPQLKPSIISLHLNHSFLNLSPVYPFLYFSVSSLPPKSLFIFSSSRFLRLPFSKSLSSSLSPSLSLRLPFSKSLSLPLSFRDVSFPLLPNYSISWTMNINPEK